MFFACAFFRFCQSLFPTCELQFSKFRMCVFFSLFAFVLVLFLHVWHVCFVRFACFACVFLLFLHVLHVCSFCLCMFDMCAAFVLHVLHVCSFCLCMFDMCAAFVLHVLHAFLLFCMFCLQFDYYFSNGLRPALRIQIYDTDASNLK